VISSINTATSLFGGVAVFSVLGFMAKEQHMSVADVAQSGIMFSLKYACPNLYYQTSVLYKPLKTSKCIFRYISYPRH